VPPPGVEVAGKRCWTPLIAATVVAALALPAGAQTPSPAPSSSPSPDAGQVTQEAATRVKDDLVRLAGAYADQNARLNATEARMTQTRQDITHGLQAIASLEAQLRARSAAAYGARGVGFLQVLLDARSFADFSARYAALQRQSTADAGLIEQLRRKRAQLEADGEQLANEHAVEQEEAGVLREQAGRLTVSFSDAQQLAASLEGKLSPAEIAQLFRMGGSPAAGIVIPLAACPVAGPHFVNNDFGAPRSGGTRRHQGNDIMAPMGTPIVAPLAGTITTLQSGGLGGLAIFEQGAGNVEFYFAHEQEIDAHQGQQVAAGDRIGFVGNTGDAAGGPSHLHFEIHPGSGPAIDPYPSLSAVC
jgi:murein DD-endopeptidase MepM/ murein hydrolase activator NlpD